MFIPERHVFAGSPQSPFRVFSLHPHLCRISRHYLGSEGLSVEDLIPCLAHIQTIPEGVKVQKEKYFLPYVLNIMLQQHVKTTN